MKKVLFSGIMMGVLGATSAMADTTTQLTTKGYVDAGLKAVYLKAEGLAADAKTAADNAQATATEAKTAATNAANKADKAQLDIDALDRYVGNKSGVTDGGVSIPASGLAKDVEDLENDVGDKNNLTTTNKENLVGAINEVNQTVSTINAAIQNQQVQAGAGVTVNGSTVSVKGLNEITAADPDGIYVFQGNTATKLNVATTWADPDWLQ